MRGYSSEEFWEDLMGVTNGWADPELVRVLQLIEKKIQNPIRSLG